MNITIRFGLVNTEEGGYKIGRSSFRIVRKSAPDTKHYWYGYKIESGPAMHSKISMWAKRSMPHRTKRKVTNPKCISFYKQPKQPSLLFSNIRRTLSVPDFFSLLAWTKGGYNNSLRLFPIYCFFFFLGNASTRRMSRTCSQCGNNGHNSRTCAEASAGGGGGENAIMLFGVRVTEGNSFRKSASMTNLSQYDQQPQDSNPDAGYASDDVVHPSGRSRERKRGTFLSFIRLYFLFVLFCFVCLFVSFSS